MLLKTDSCETHDVGRQPFIEYILRHIGLELAFPYEENYRMDSVMADTLSLIHI